MAAESKRICPICLDDFKDPKLLHCVHTFCRTCLEGCTNDQEADVGITCPICRVTTLWSRDGIDGLMSNYFVPHTKDCKPDSCQLCGSDTKVRVCMVCERTLCRNCRSMHECVWLVDRTNYPECDVTSPLKSVNATPGKFKTVFRAPLLAEFSIDFKECKTQSINLIVPINENESWVVESNGPDVIRCDMFGTMRESHHLGDGIIDGALSPDGKLFLLCVTLRCLTFLENKKWYKFIDFYEDDIPEKFSILSDGKIVLVILEDSVEQSTHDDDSNGNLKSYLSRNNERRKQRGVIVVLDNYGIVKGRFNKNSDFLPCDIACCPSMDSICICDAQNGTVDIILSDGTLLGSYHGSNSRPTFDFLRLFPHRRNNNFKPQQCTVDSEGNFYIADGESKLIHILSPTADLLGVIATDALGGFGFPLHIAVDSSGKLWTGNDKYGKIRVFRITQCINEFSRPSFGSSN